jgi:O-antigen/teichoic acid export membrane protein
VSIKITKKDIQWSYFALIFSNGVNVVLLPFVLNRLSANEIGLWYTFTAIGAIAVLLDFGLMTTVTRNVALIWSGVSVLRREGYETSDRKKDGLPNYDLLNQFLEALRLIYFLMSMIILVLLSTIGSAYIFHVCKSQMNPADYLPAWIIYLVAAATSVYYNYLNSVLKGMGAILQSQKTTVISKAIQLVVSLVGLSLGHGLIGLSVAYLASAIAMRQSAGRYFWNYENNRQDIYLTPLFKTHLREVSGLLKVIWPNTYKEGVITLAGYLSGQADILFSSAFLSLRTSSAVGLTQQMFTLIIPVGNALYNSFIPLFSTDRIEEKSADLKQKFCLSSGMSFYTALLGGLAAIFCAPYLLRLIHSNSEIISRFPAVLMLVYLILNNNHTLCGSFIATGNRVPTYKAYVFTAVVFCFSQIILLNYTSLGVYALILPILICQLCYNNWRWPLEVAREFGMKLHELIKEQMLEPIITFRMVIKHK